MASVLALVLAGCAPSGPDVVDFQGKLTSHGKPVSNVLIHFLPDSGRPSSGRTDDEGNFRLSFSKDIPRGAIVGKHKVYVTMEPGRVDERIDLRDPRFHPDMQRILQKYGSYRTTPKEVEITPTTRSLEIELD